MDGQMEQREREREKQEKEGGWMDRLMDERMDGYINIER